MKVYISGKITGDPDYRTKFEKAEEELKKRGHIVLNPAVLPDGLTREEYMCIDLAMLGVADAVALLPDHGDSSGATVEKALAEYCGKRIKLLTIGGGKDGYKARQYIIDEL